MKISRILFAAAVLFTATVSANAADKQLATRYSATTSITEALPASIEELRRGGISEEIIFFAAESAGQIPPEDIPNIGVYVEGTGDVRVSGTIPVPSPAPVLILTKKSGCVSCPFNLRMGMWPQGIAMGPEPTGKKDYRLESVPDQLGWAYGGGFNRAGQYDVKIAVLHPRFGVWMSQVFTVDVYDLDFYAWSCRSGVDVKVVFNVAALRKINRSRSIFIKIDGIGGLTGPVAVQPTTPREFESEFLFSAEEYDSLIGGNRAVSVSFNGKSREKELTFWPAVNDCGTPPKG